MRIQLPIWIGLRYTRSSNKQRFLSLLSWISLIGMMLGVAALITVLSVMNGFQAELRDRMLGLMTHGQVEQLSGDAYGNWQELQRELVVQPQVLAAAPLVGGDAMLSSRGVLRAVELKGVELSEERSVANIEKHIIAGDLGSLATQRYGIVMGHILARSLGLNIGDRVTVVLPKVTVTPLGPKPRLKQFKLLGVFEVGADMDATHAYIRIQDAQRLYGTGNKVHAVRYLTSDVLNAAAVAKDLQQQLSNSQLKVVPWTQQRVQLFSAIKMEKLMVMLMLSMVIAVAAFNLISVLSMMVADKRNEVAVLRMMGMGQQQVLTVFMTQGVSLALVAVLVGGLLGVLLALNLTDFIQLIEQTFGFYIFDPRVFYISGLPSELQQGDVLYVVSFSLLLSILFSAYPAYRAAKIQPVEALQYQ